MQVIGLHPLIEPFIGHGTFIINGHSTDNIRGRSLAMILEQLNSLSTGVVASIDEESRLVLDSHQDFTVGGHQDVLDTLGIEASA